MGRSGRGGSGGGGFSSHSSSGSWSSHSSSRSSSSHSSSRSSSVHSSPLKGRSGGGGTHSGPVPFIGGPGAVPPVYSDAGYRKRIEKGEYGDYADYGGGGMAAFIQKSGIRLFWLAVAVLLILFALTRVSGLFREAETLNKDAYPYYEQEELLSDLPGWLSERGTRDTVSAMDYFYESTGVQPALIITEDDGTGSARAFAGNAYDSLFEDEGHVLLYLCDYGDGDYYFDVSAGDDAYGIITQNSTDFASVFKRYWSGDLSDDEMFPALIREYADRITGRPTLYEAAMALGSCFLLAMFPAAYIYGTVKEWKEIRKTRKLREKREKERKRIFEETGEIRKMEGKLTEGDEGAEEERMRYEPLLKKYREM